MDLSNVVSDPSLAEAFTVTRKVGSFGAGGWIPGTPQIIPAFGIVSVASGKDLMQIPEGDRVEEARVFHTAIRLYETSAAGSETSDVLTWQGTDYRIMKVNDYSNRGYYWVIAARMAGN